MSTLNTSLALGKLTAIRRSIYIVPSNTRTSIKFVEFVNNDTADRVLTLSISRQQVLHTKSITLASNFSLSGKYNLDLNSGDSLDAFADKDGVIDYIITGSQEIVS